MTKTIVWMSRHQPTVRQLSELNRLYPGHKLLHDARSFDGADEIVSRYRTAKADDMVIVAPLTVVRELVLRGIRPLWAQMEQVPCRSPRVEVRIKNRCYRFVRFHRINAVKMELTDPFTGHNT